MQAANLSPTQTPASTWVPLAVPATRIFTMAVTSSRCFFSSNSSTLKGQGEEADGHCHLRGSTLPSPAPWLGRTLNTTT